MNTKALANVFNINEPSKPIRTSDQIVPSDTLEDAPIVPRNLSESITPDDELSDIDYARRTLQFSIERSQQLVELALSNAADGSSPRDIEAAANALNTCAALSEKLIDVHTKIAKKNKPDTGSGNTFVNNNNRTYVLSSSELLDELTKDTESHES